MLKHLRGAIAIAICAFPAAAVSQAAPAQHPSLVVVITIDGFRGDYLTRFGPQMTGGLSRLMKGGAWFTNAHQDHGITETAPGHASILSGRFPRSTGIAANRIGVGDPDSPLLGFSGVLGASPLRFQGTELFDWIHAADSKSRALSVSAKDRGAILPVGRSKQQVYWYPGDGEFTTSRYYADSLPAWVQKFNSRLLPQSYAGKKWTPLLPDSAYKEVDSVSVEGNGVDFVFPHDIPSDPDRAASWVRATPFMDEIIVAMALDGVNALGIGKGPSTDLLAISLSATDAVSHRLGPQSKEAHDQALRDDKTIGVFLDSLFRLRDPSRVVVVLTADHGFTPIPELAPANANPHPTRASLLPALAAARAQMTAAKVDSLAIDLDQQIVLMDRSAFKGSKLTPDAVIQTFEKTARSLPGIARIDKFPDLAKDSARDPIARRWSHQFPANTNVELVATLTPGSLWGTLLVASHGSPYDFDSNVPVIFYGPGIAAARHSQFVRTVDIAPTLAKLLGVKPLEKLDGVPLSIGR
ncbi:MAG TPA: alkaline phosphatase family protein [Gemmatimonadaceae bacterium]|nr:alkaline phosphatase family protein [Gemmatimonadaceae bacterium]